MVPKRCQWPHTFGLLSRRTVFTSKRSMGSVLSQELNCVVGGYRLQIRYDTENDDPTVNDARHAPTIDTCCCPIHTCCGKSRLYT